MPFPMRGGSPRTSDFGIKSGAQLYVVLDQGYIDKPTFDRLEGFHPDGPCLYRRVLVPVRIKEAVFPAWLYVGEDPISGGLKPLGKPIWTR